jgi:hypothetical protein
LCESSDGADVKLKAFAIVFLCGVVTFVAMNLLSGAAQGEPSRPDFDVATIKPASRGEISPANPMYLRPGNAPGSLEARNAFLMFLISNAYGVKMAQIYNGPGWMRSDGYDISAKTDLTPDDAQKIGTSLDERAADMNLRLQSLLEDRFRLKVHRETRQLPVFMLTVAKGGLKVQPPDCVTRGAYPYAGTRAAFSQILRDVFALKIRCGMEIDGTWDHYEGSGEGTLVPGNSESD